MIKTIVINEVLPLLCNWQESDNMCVIFQTFSQGATEVTGSCPHQWCWNLVRDKCRPWLDTFYSKVYFFCGMVLAVSVFWPEDNFRPFDQMENQPPTCYQQTPIPAASYFSQKYPVQELLSFQQCSWGITPWVHIRHRLAVYLSQRSQAFDLDGSKQSGKGCGSVMFKAIIMELDLMPSS